MASSKITREDVKKLASLARINISPDEEENLAKDMENILAYVTQIQEFSAGAFQDAVVEKARIRNVLRDDDHPHESGAFAEEILAEAPKRQGQYIKVKKILQ